MCSASCSLALIHMAQIPTTTPMWWVFVYSWSCLQLECTSHIIRNQFSVLLSINWLGGSCFALALLLHPEDHLLQASVLIDVLFQWNKLFICAHRMLSVRIESKGCDLYCKKNSSAVILRGAVGCRFPP